MGHSSPRLALFLTKGDSTFEPGLRIFDAENMRPEAMNSSPKIGRAHV